MMRVQVPPPKSRVKGQKAGWNRASPERPSRMKLMPTIQWFSRSLGV